MIELKEEMIEIVDKVLSMTKYSKDTCHNLVAKALREGTLEKEPCFVCGDNKSVAHHPDYNLPLDVVWLCHRDHMKLHHANRLSLA